MKSVSLDQGKISSEALCTERRDLPGEDSSLVLGLVLDKEADVVLRMTGCRDSRHLELSNLERVLVLELRSPISSSHLSLQHGNAPGGSLQAPACSPHKPPHQDARR